MASVALFDAVACYIWIEDSTSSQLYRNFCCSHSLSQTISQPTRFREGQVSNILDLVILSSPDVLMKNVITTPVDNSNNVVIILELCLSTKQPSSKQQKYVNYKLVSKKLADVNWIRLITDEI